MSSSYYVYVGPYLRLKVKKVDDITKEYGCVKINGPYLLPSIECLAYKKPVSRSSKFCTVCGSALEEFDKTIQKKAVDIHDILGEEYEDSLFRCDMDDIKEYEYWLPNHYYGVRPLSFSKDHGEREVTNIDKQAEISWFYERYNEEIILIKNATDDYEILWGIISYYH